MDQRYVSNALTHFVGRNCTTDDELYDMLASILKTGFLKASPTIGDTARLEVLRNKSFSSGEMYRCPMVCFCDIPIADFEIHMAKYSRFGLSFLKSFLVVQGACPVFYIARDSQTTEIWPPVWSGKA